LEILPKEETMQSSSLYMQIVFAAALVAVNGLSSNALNRRKSRALSRKASRSIR
jgi:hypothetical protein